jgi:hypothetical protein
MHKRNVWEDREINEWKSALTDNQLNFYISENALSLYCKYRWLNAV